MPATPTNTDPVTVEQILTEGQLLFETSDLYFGHGTDNAWDEAVFLVFYALDLPPDADRSVLNQQLTDIQCKAIHQLFEQRIRDRIPAAYLTGRAWFCGLPFAVDKRVIIPRSPIAELIMSGFYPWCSTEPQRLLDLCTGSGCIGIACAYAFENAEVVLSDICADALQVAQQNIQQHDLAARVSAVQSDLFENLADQKFDLIVSNPPYVDADDYASMPDEYFHEPELALASISGRVNLATLRQHQTENPPLGTTDDPQDGDLATAEFHRVPEHERHRDRPGDENADAEGDEDRIEARDDAEESIDLRRR